MCNPTLHMMCKSTGKFVYFTWTGTRAGVLHSQFSCYKHEIPIFSLAYPLVTSCVRTPKIINVSCLNVPLNNAVVYLTSGFAHRVYRHYTQSKKLKRERVENLHVQGPKKREFCARLELTVQVHTRIPCGSMHRKSNSLSAV